MQFTVLERLMLANLLPAEGDITTLLIVRQLREALSFTEDEHAVLKFVTVNDSLSWQNGVGPKEIPIGNRALTLICNLLDALEEAKKLTPNHISLWEKFRELPTVEDTKDSARL